MDPVSVILAALIAGSAAGLQASITDALKDAYAALKRIITDRYKGVDVKHIERDPAAADSRRSMERQLRDSGAAADPDVLAQAHRLLDEAARSQPELAAVVGVDLNRIRAGNIRIEDIVSSGHGVKVEDAAATGDFTIANVRAGGTPIEGKQ